MNGRQGRYGAVLAEPDYRRLFLSQLPSELGDFAGRIALAILVTSETGSALGAGGVLAVSAIPYLGPGQVLTSWAARFDPRRVLVGCDIIRALAYVAIAVDLPLWLRFALLLVASGASPVFEAVRNGLTPHTVPTVKLTDAIAFQTITNEVTRIGGLAIGGIVATAVSPAAALLANAGTFVISAIFLAGLSKMPVPRDLGRVRVREGWAALTGDPVARRVLWLFPALVAFGSVPEALVVPYVAAELPADPSLAGVLAALVSVSIVVTVPLLRQPGPHRERVWQASTLGALGAVLAAAAFALPSSVLTAGVAYLCLGIIFAGRVNTGSAVSERLDDRVRASAYSVLDGVISLGQLVAGLGGGALAEWIGVVPCFVVSLLLTAAVATTSRLLPLRPAPAAAVSRPD